MITGLSIIFSKKVALCDKEIFSRNVVDISFGLLLIVDYKFGDQIFSMVFVVSAWQNVIQIVRFNFLIN